MAAGSVGIKIFHSYPSAGGPFGLLLRGHQLVGLMAQGFQRALVADYHDPEHMGSQDLPQDSHQLEGGQDGSPCAAQVTATHLHQAAQQHASGNHARLGKVVSLQHPSRHLLVSGLSQRSNWW